MKVNEIFYSIDGEGIRAGLPVIFIRLYGCNLRCKYCDTSYSYEGKYNEMTADEIIQEIKKADAGCKRITLTGGEPLIHPGVDILIEKLLDNDYEVNIETNGSVNIEKYLKYKNVILTVDYKSIYSGMNNKMYLNNFEILRENDVLKFVVANKEDLEQVLLFYKKTKANIYLSPVFGQINASEIVEFILENKLYDCRVQLQLHKYIWEPDRRGV